MPKAAALLHSLARNHPLVDGNTRLAWLATYVFCAKNGVTLDPDDDAAYNLVVAVASGELEDVEAIAAALRRCLTGHDRLAPDGKGSSLECTAGPASRPSA